MKLNRQSARRERVRTAEVLGTPEKPDSGYFDLRTHFPKLLEDYLKPLIENEDLSVKRKAVCYAYLVSIAEYFGRPLPFPEPTDQQALENKVRDAFEFSRDPDLNTEPDPFIRVMDLTRAFIQVFPGAQPPEYLLTNEALEGHLPSGDPKSWGDPETLIVTEDQVVEWQMAIECVVARPDLRAKVEALITDDAVFQKMWNDRQLPLQKWDEVRTLRELAEVSLVWPRAREFFQFEPQELEKIVRQELTKWRGDHQAHLELLWSVAVLTASQGWIGDQGKIHLRPPTEPVGFEARSLPPRSLVP